MQWPLQSSAKQGQLCTVDMTKQELREQQKGRISVSFGTRAKKGKAGGAEAGWEAAPAKERLSCG